MTLGSKCQFSRVVYAKLGGCILLSIPRAHPPAPGSSGAASEFLSESIRVGGAQLRGLKGSGR